MNQHELITEGIQLMNGIDITGSDGYAKYADAYTQIREKNKIIRELGLHNSQPKECLDISTCFGWFTWLMQKYGHKMWYTDNLAEKYQTVRESRKRLGLYECVHFQYLKKEKTSEWLYQIIPFERKFDVITAVAVQPHSFFDEKLWSMFIEDVKKHLNTGGFAYIAPNTSMGSRILAGMLQTKYNGFIVR